MKKKTSKHSPGRSEKGMRHARRSKKKNEVASDRSLQSSLTSDVGLAPRTDEDASFAAGQSGDLQGISNLAEADPESVEELLEDGQALEAEVVEGVEDVRDEKEVPSRGRLDADAEPHSFDERNKI